MALPIIRYLWVGLPTKFDKFSYLAHDVIGPIETATQLKYQKSQGDEVNELGFICLEEYVDYYRTFFAKEGLEVEVVSIEGMLRSQAEANPKTKLTVHAQILLGELVSLKKNAFQDKRKVIAFKNKFSVFELSVCVGYILDTNVKVSSPGYTTDVFLAPSKYKIIYKHIPECEGVAVVEHPESGECKKSGDFFSMYSSECGSSTALYMLEQIMPQDDVYNHLFVLHLKNGPSFYPGFHPSLGRAAVGPAQGLQKQSYKSYHHPLAGPPPRGLSSRARANPTFFAFYARYGDINEIMFDEFQDSRWDYTIKHVSGANIAHKLISLHQYKNLAIALNRGVDLTVKAEFIAKSAPGKILRFTPLKLAEYLYEQELIPKYIVSRLRRHLHNQELNRHLLFNRVMASVARPTVPSIPLDAASVTFTANHIKCV